jgi:hypothetical protein
MPYHLMSTGARRGLQAVVCLDFIGGGGRGIGADQLCVALEWQWNRAVPLQSLMRTSRVTLPPRGTTTVSFQAGACVYGAAWAASPPPARRGRPIFSEGIGRR